MATLTCLIASVLLISEFYRWICRPSISHIRGPRPELFFGNVRHIIKRSNVEAMLEWQEEFGSVFRFQGFFGSKKLIVADPKALHHILNTAAYEFPKPGAFRAVIRAISGPNIVAAEGDDHKKQRRLMSPAFGVRETKAYLSIFKACAEKVVMKWQDAVVHSDDQSTVVDVHHTLLPATLEALCEATFDFQMDNKRGDDLRKLYANFNNDAFPPNAAILAALLDWIPTCIITPLLRILPVKNVAFIRKHRRQSYEIAAEIMAEKSHAIAEGRESRDLCSLLVKANASEKVKDFQLTQEELYAQSSVVFIAGHDTTAGTLTFGLWQLARHVGVQTRLREEVRATLAAIRARGKAEPSVEDMESMPYLQAVMKETLRLHPAVAQIARSAGKDCVLPLSYPVETASGELIRHIAVPKGTEIVVAISCYNRNKNVWGEDAHVFRPDRWLAEEQPSKSKTSVGVIGNIASFLSGTRSCLGWKFAMLEMQSFLVEIIDQFELRATKEIRPWGDNLVYPLVDGEEEKGAQMPLRISPASRD
ncbi:cytochrome P450 [Neolentinus lepideus HHB14362 ss-1]|uniref:Cytochrome P450 n=1 Tax=Neolentinus lepideus HHB14362 ss-1 TaxID=1314782 RepID=A0A165U029_9AGAM|nr:cytochrome P450 [Neolentinus lepideus HHB14362 ss-1]